MHPTKRCEKKRHRHFLPKPPATHPHLHFAPPHLPRHPHHPHHPPPPAPPYFPSLNYLSSPKCISHLPKILTVQPVMISFLCLFRIHVCRSFSHLTGNSWCALRKHKDIKFSPFQEHCSIDRHNHFKELKLLLLLCHPHTLFPGKPADKILGRQGAGEH